VQNKNAAQKSSNPTLLAGIVVCAHCGAKMSAFLHQRPAVLPAWISCPLPAAFSGSPTWGSSPGIPCRRSCGFQGATGKTETKKPSQNRPALPSLFLEGHASRLCNG